MTAIIKRTPYNFNVPAGNLIDLKAQFKIVRPFRIITIGTSSAVGLALHIGSKDAPAQYLTPGIAYPNSTDFFDPLDYYMLINPYPTQESINFWIDTITQTNYNI